ncbi:2-oxoglutarate dehydrogenase E1 component [Macrococcoides canis]|uniref:2-oxoglutarate dehydrogenase E1 component n=1 Tax=Macrococcoides canis TaxID=1855823 RepID=A0A1W7ABA2_9STAP|nr:2-oxoglutarate dehydrogenase E1 component [Macrococcus canis]
MTKGKNLEEAPPRFGTNLGILLEMFDQYQNDPSSVSDELQELFSNIQGVVQGNQLKVMQTQISSKD